MAIRKQSHQGQVLEEIRAVQGLPGGSSGSSSGGTLGEAQVSVAGPVSDDEYAFPQESYVRWNTHQYANCCQVVRFPCPLSHISHFPNGHSLVRQAAFSAR